jgi:hypothetical protein
MRYISIILFISLSIILSNPLFGQDDTLGLVGLGISIDPTKGTELVYINSSWENLQSAPITNTSSIVFYVPLNVTNRIRFEPSIGLFSTSSSTTTTSIPQGSSYPQTISNDASVTTIGIRGTYISSLTSSLILYFGPRLEFGFVSSTQGDVYAVNYPVVNTRIDNKTITKETDMTFGGVIGAEYFPIRKFSIGGEISLNYVTFGNPDITNEYNPPPSAPIYTTERDQHTLYTGALFFLRWYVL